MTDTPRTLHYHLCFWCGHTWHDEHTGQPCPRCQEPPVPDIYHQLADLDKTLVRADRLLYGNTFVVVTQTGHVRRLDPGKVIIDA